MLNESIKELSRDIKKSLQRHGVVIIETSFITMPDNITYFRVIIPSPTKPLGIDPSSDEIEHYYQIIGDHIGIITDDMSSNMFIDYFNHTEVEVAKDHLMLSFSI